MFVVGALEETIVLRGMRYHPIDIENTVMRCHQKIAESYVSFICHLVFIVFILTYIYIFICGTNLSIYVLLDRYMCSDYRQYRCYMAILPAYFSPIYDPPPLYLHYTWGERGIIIYLKIRKFAL